MNKLQKFYYQNHEIRAIQQNGEPWFVLKDVCGILAISNPTDVAKRLDTDEVTRFNLGGQAGETNIVNEPGLYNVILRSDKPEAKSFKRWLTHEVLPSIRKHGMYAIDELLENPDIAIQAFTALKEERARNKELTIHNAQLEQKVSEYEPKAQYVDTILSSPGAVTITQIAADYSLSARALNKILHEERIQHNVGGQWILYKEHMGLGYTKSETIQFERSDGKPDTKMQTKWTQKGRLLIHNLLERRGIQANMDKPVANKAS